MYVLSFVNQKGGVGKTTLAMHTAVRLAMAGAKVLLVDMDPQCSLSYIAHAEQPQYTVMEAMQGTISTKGAILSSPECDILPGSPRLSLLERKLIGDDRAMRLKQALNQCQEDYHYVVIDSPPALGVLMLNVLAASDSVVIPTLADVFSLQGIGQLYSTIRAVKKNVNPRLEIDGIVLSREEAQSKLSRDVETMLHATAMRMGTQLFETYIRRDNLVSEAHASRQSLFRYAPDSPMAGDYSRFTLEYLKRLRLRLCR